MNLPVITIEAIREPIQAPARKAPWPWLTILKLNLLLAPLTAAICCHLESCDEPEPEPVGLIPAHRHQIEGEYQGWPVTHVGDGWFSCLLPDGNFLHVAEGREMDTITREPNPFN